MNSPLYIGVVVHPDREPDHRIEVVSYAESYPVADAQAMRAWQKAQSAWDLRHEEGDEPPFHDVYVCARRLLNMTDEQDEDVCKNGNVGII